MPDKLAYVHVSAQVKDEAREAWLKEKWANGEKIQYWPCMDGSDYGLHYLYGFEDHGLAEVFKLKFDTVGPNGD